MAARVFKVSLELAFDKEKSQNMSKENLCDMIWQRIMDIGNGFQMLDVSKVTEVSDKLAQKQLMSMCEKACERERSNNETKS